MRCCEHGSTNGTKQRSREDKYFGRTYTLVKKTFSCEYKGEVEAKGKGVIRIYYVW